MTTNVISPHSDVYHASNPQTNYVQLRNWFRRLLEAVKDGNITEAQQAFDILTNTMRKEHQTLDAQLGKNYTTIGQALHSKDIHGAQKAALQLQRNSQNVTLVKQTAVPAETLAGGRRYYTPQGDIVNFYAAYDRVTNMIGNYIDISV